MGTNDYQYDAIGNLIEDQSEEIDAIEWTAYGKVKSVARTSGSTKPNLAFTYDASGNRATKTVKNGLLADQWERTYYIRDAAGQLLATYSSKMDQNTTNGGTHVARFVLEDQQLYGSSRLSSKTINKELFTEEFTWTLGADFWDYSGTSAGHQVAPAPANRGQQVRGEVRYELTSHLGNVRSVITDRKLPTQNGGVVDYAPDVVSAQDYYPFGSLMSGRQYANTSFTNDDYRFGFNGMERDDEVKGGGDSYDFGARIYDARLGRWLARDKHQFFYSNKSPYQFVSNSPILMIDVDGNYNVIYIYVGDSYKRGDKCIQLSATQQQEVFDKTVRVFEMINEKLENGLGVGMMFAMTAAPFGSQYLDESDILAMAADLDYAESTYGSLLSKNERDDPGITKGRDFSGNFTKPAFANMGSSEFAYSSPNFTDQMAYALAHEIIHRVTQKAGDNFTDHDDGKSMKFNIMESGTQLFPLPDLPLEEWDSTLENEKASYFTLLPSSQENFKTVFGGRTPRDNATERVRRKQHKEGPGGLVPRRKRHDFRKWKRQK